MKTIHFSCGCSISRTMFPPYPVVGTNVCHKHTQIPDIQRSLERLAGAIGKLGGIEHEPSANIKKVKL